MRRTLALPVFPDPNADPASRSRVFLDSAAFDGSVFSATVLLADEMRGSGSLKEYRERISARPARAKARLQERIARLRLDPTPTMDQAFAALQLYQESAFVALYEGDHRAAASWLLKALDLARMPEMPAPIRAHMMALLGINALRRGEKDNCIDCVGPSSCIFPIAAEAVHTRPAGSREAVRVVHRVPRGVARRPARPLAAEHRLHDAGRVSGEGPAAVPDPARAVPLEARRGPVRERRDPGRPERAGARPGRRQHLRRLQRRRPPRPLHDLVRRRPAAPRCSSTAATARSRTARRRPASTTRSMP